MYYIIIHYTCKNFKTGLIYIIAHIDIIMLCDHVIVQKKIKKNVQKKETYYGCGRKKIFLYTWHRRNVGYYDKLYSYYYYIYIYRLMGSDVSSYVHMYINIMGTSQIPFSPPHGDDVTSTRIIMNNNTPSPSVCITCVICVGFMNHSSYLPFMYTRILNYITTYTTVA